MGKARSYSTRKSRIRAPYLGKISLYWCDTCNLPVLENFRCNICNNLPRKVSITPPGDVRPAFIKDYSLLQSVVNNQYGSPIGDYMFSTENIMLLNRIGGLDRTDEVILSGQKVGLFQYNPIRAQFEFYPSQLGGEIILFLQQKLNIPPKKQIFLNSDGLPYILAGKSVLVPGVSSFTQDIKKNDYVLIVYQDDTDENVECIAIGISLGTSKGFREMKLKNFGQLSKTKRHRKSMDENQEKFIRGLFSTQKFNNNSISSEKGLERILQNLQIVYDANNSYILSQIKKAGEFIRNTIDSIQKPVAVAYSGGKDSLATLMLVYDVLGPIFKIFFADTGLELPEVLQNVKDIAKTLQMEDKLVIRSANEKFWEILKSFGPPGRDYRYCCHSLKAQNITAIIENLYDSQKVLVFLGQRQYESINRSRSSMVYTNSFIPLQIAATPIKKWVSLLLWLVILCHPFKRHKSKAKIDVPITNLYFAGHERLGCYLCPASNLSTFELLRESHPDYYDRWFSYLKEYAAEHSLPKQWIDWGLWRYKQLPPQWNNILHDQGVSIQFTQIDPSAPLQFNLTKGFSPCLQDGYSVKGKFSEPLDLEHLLNYIPALTSEYIWDGEMNVLSLNSRWKGKKYRMNLFPDGSLFLLSPDKNFDVSSFLLYLIGIVLRAVYCNQCKTCVSICPEQAITLGEKGVKISPEKCTHCLKCISHCPLFQNAKKIAKNANI